MPYFLGFSFLFSKEVINREVLLSSLINAIPDLVWLKDKDGVYLACNSRFEDFFGASEGEILGKTDYDFLETHLADFFRTHDQNAMTKGSALTNEEEIVFASDGHSELLETTKTPMYDNNEELIGILGIGRDITERKLLQEQLAQSRKLESVGRLAGGVAHDFNNMLSIILGNSELIQDDISEGSSLDDHLQQIMYAAKRSAWLTRQLLAFARQETISPKKLDLNHNLEGILNMLRRLIGENIELVWKPGKNLWVIHMDAGQIDQIMTNLCVNARDSIDNVGCITIETQNISIDEAYCLEHADAQVQDYVMLTISDTGAGMSKEVQAHIFEPFYTTKISTKGTGLGLATVYGIMKQNQGFINVYSEPDKGSAFKLFFPRCIAGEETKALKETHQNLPSGDEVILLLLVEDKISFYVRVYG
nr:PAS domain-containing protein [uncultured Desulfobacter sp.]